MRNHFLTRTCILSLAVLLALQDRMPGGGLKAQVAGRTETVRLSNEKVVLWMDRIAQHQLARAKPR